MKEVGILVVTYNRIKLLQECIESLRLQTFQDYDIIVVNNSSTDGTQEWLNTQSDIITITQKNSGGAGGFYTGLKYIAEQGYGYCWLMDDDVVCNSNALECLLKTAHKYPDSGFFCMFSEYDTSSTRSLPHSCPDALLKSRCTNPAVKVLQKTCSCYEACRTMP